MTVATRPLTIEGALRLVLSAIGAKHAAALLDRDVDYVRCLANPNSRYRLTVADKLRLDLAYDERFGGFPIHETASAILSAQRAQQAIDGDLVAPAASAALETGQAIAAMIVASMPDSTIDQRREAAREWQEAQIALTRCGPVLHRMLMSGPSP